MASTIYNLSMTIIEVKNPEKWILSWRRLNGAIPPEGLELHTEKKKK